jgi:hypothetical protein
MTLPIGPAKLAPPSWLTYSAKVSPSLLVDATTGSSMSVPSEKGVPNTTAAPVGSPVMLTGDQDDPPSEVWKSASAAGAPGLTITTPAFRVLKVTDCQWVFRVLVTGIGYCRNVAPSSRETNSLGTAPVWPVPASTTTVTMPLGPGVIITERDRNRNPSAAVGHAGTSVVYDHPAEVEVSLR